MNPESSNLKSTRRTALRLGALAPLAVAADAFDGQAVTRFVSLCAKLTGFPEHALDRRFAHDLLQALTAQGVDAEDLRALGDAEDGGVRDDGGRAGERSGLADLAVEIVSAWYAGLLPTKLQPTVAKFYDALVWQALDFAAAPTACTRPGAWAEAPERRESDGREGEEGT